MLKNLIFFVFISAALLSCSKNSNPANPGSTTDNHPKAGSIFTFDEYSTDSTNAVIAGSRDTITSTVLRTDGAMSNKTGVLFIEENLSGVKDTAYYAYEANNNLSMLTNASDPNLAMWETIPTGTGTTIIRATGYSIIGIDTTDVRDSTITSLVSAESMIIKGQSVSVKKMLLSFRHSTTSSSGGSMETKVDNLLYYAPSLGYVVKTESKSRPDPFGGWIDGTFQTLIDYNLK